MFFSVITTNLTMETLTKNLAAFKRWERGGGGGLNSSQAKKRTWRKRGSIVSEKGGIKAHYDVDGFANEPVVQCDVRYVKKYFCR